MHISKRSTFHQFLKTNWFTTDDSLPTNLCPFMRKVLGSIIVNFLVAGAVTWMAICAFVMAPAMWFGLEISDAQVAFAILGTMEWLVFSGFLSIYLLGRLNSVSRATERVAGLNSYQTTVGWMHAIHDKVCPWITYS